MIKTLFAAAIVLTPLAITAQPTQCGLQTDIAEADRLANNVRWKTASEVDNFGYDVYRGDEEAGPFIVLNESPLPGAGTTDSPSEYAFRDDSIDPCRAYWYYVESISVHGEREKFTPTFRAKPKLDPTAPAVETDAAQ